MKLRLWFIGFIALALGFCAIPLSAQQSFLPNSSSGTLGAANAIIAVSPVYNGGTCAADITGTWSGTITFQVSGNSGTVASALAYTYGGASQGTTTTGNGQFYWVSSGMQTCQVKMTSYSSGTATVTVSVSAGTAALPPNVISSLPPVTLVTPVPVTQTGAPWTVNATIVAPTVSPGLFPGVTLACPSTAPANINGAYTCSITSSGNLNTSCQGGCTPSPQPTVSPGGWIGRQLIKAGSSTNTYVDTLPDTLVATGNIASGTTTQIAAGVANQNMYVWAAWFQSAGTNSNLTLNLEYGQGATCQTNTKAIYVSAIVAGAPATGANVGLWSGANISSLQTGMAPASIPFIVPANASTNNLCGVTGGTTVNGSFSAYVSNHAN